jgi:hypothetical protein
VKVYSLKVVATVPGYLTVEESFTENVYDGCLSTTFVSAPAFPSFQVYDISYHPMILGTGAFI